MIQFKSFPVELRGALSKQTKDGRLFALLNVEDESGTHYQYYSPDIDVIPSDVNKGDMIHLICSHSVYNHQDKISVIRIEKVK